MSKIEELDKLLLGMRDLLSAHNMPVGAQIFHDLWHDWQTADSRESRSDIGRRILHLYQGMGSFNDLTLQDREHPHGNLLEPMRSRLHEVAFSFVH